MTTDIDNTIHYGSMPKQVKQQVTAGNPTEEPSAMTEIQDIQEQTPSNPNA
jgi:hypothetical protein